MSTREDDISAITYFWQERGDLERWCGFDRERMKQEFPAVLMAWDNYQASWDNYQASRRILSDVVRKLEQAGEQK